MGEQPSDRKRQGLLYPFVRIDGQDGRFALPSKAPFSAIPAFDPKAHRGKALCPNTRCSAKLTFYKAAQTVAGGEAGYPAHFKLKAGSAHIANCPYEGEKHEDTGASREVDYTKGYRIHYNPPKITQYFMAASGPIIARGPDGHFECRDPDMADREVLHARNVAEFERLLRNADPARMRDSYILHAQGKFPFMEFLVRTPVLDGKPSYKRWIGLAERLLEGKAQPAMIVFEFDRKHATTTRGNWTHVDIPLHSFVMKHPKTDEMIVVQPHIILNKPGVFELGQQPSEYMAFGIPTIKRLDPRYTRGPMPVYALDMIVNTRSAIAESDIGAYGRQAKAKHGYNGPQASA